MEKRIFFWVFCTFLMLSGCGGSGSNSPSSGSGGIVGGVTPPEPLIMTTSSLPSGLENEWYSTFVNIKGGVSPYNWTCSGLPSGLSWAKSDCSIRISGTPKVGSVGTFSVSISVQDSSSPKQTVSRSFSLEVMAVSSGALVIRTNSLPPVVEGQWQEFIVYASGGKTPYYWSCSGLPSGMNSGVAGNGLRIFGTPSKGTAGKSYALSISVKDSSSPQGNVSKTLTLQVVEPGSSEPLSISTVSVPSAMEGKTYEAFVEAKGGLTPYRWECDGLPAGLVSGQVGDKLRIYGTPATGTGGNSFTLSTRVTDSSNPASSVSKNFVLSVEVPPPPEPLVIKTVSLVVAVEGKPYEAFVEATGGVKPYKWVCDGLPSGLSSEQSGDRLRIYGTPATGTGGNSYDVCAEVIDSASPPVSGAKTFVLIVETKPVCNVSLPYDPQPTDTAPIKWGIYVRVCPNGDVNFMQGLANRIRTCSKNLWNMSNGQMYIARAHISDNWGWGPNGSAENGGNRDMYYRWAREEGVTLIIENLDQWYVRYIGMAAGYAGDWAYSGTFICMGGAEGWWSAPVLTHEWGHAKLHLYDEHGNTECANCVMLSGLSTYQKMMWCDRNTCTYDARKYGECWDNYIVKYFVNLKKAPNAYHTKEVPGCPEPFIEIVDR